MLFSARHCVRQHVGQYHTSVNGYSATTIDVLGTLESDLNNTASKRKETDDSQYDSGCDASPGGVMLLPWADHKPGGDSPEFVG